MSKIYSYTPAVIEGPNGTTIYIKMPVDDNNQTLGQEIARINEVRYVFIPDNASLPTQPTEITVTEVELTAETKALIKANSRSCQLIAEHMQEKIREKYSLEDEQYFARIGIGSALGIYTFEPDEQQQLADFGNYVESIRQWGRTERNKIGL